ncbi:MAG: hypothetical protein LBL91_00660 [Lachnospiraceae bacterium]|jgi:hypothetical protein|nr:hypothetical protein [Lachnospiraceae bacterium]
MKDKILYLIIGILIGAIITTGVFLVINNGNNNASQNGINRSNRGNFDPNNLPEGFDPNSIPQGGAGRTNTKYE